MAGALPCRLQLAAACRHINSTPLTHCAGQAGIQYDLLESAHTGIVRWTSRKVLRRIQRDQIHMRVHPVQ